MRTLPAMMLHLLEPFVPLFSRRVWPYVQTLLAGAILAPGKRTVSAALRVMDLGQTKQFQRYHPSSTVPFGRARKRAVCCRDCS